MQRKKLLKGKRGRPRAGRWGDAPLGEALSGGALKAPPSAPRSALLPYPSCSPVGPPEQDTDGSYGFLNGSNGYLNNLFLIIETTRGSRTKCFFSQGLCISCSFFLEHSYPRFHLGVALLLFKSH